MRNKPDKIKVLISGHESTLNKLTVLINNAPLAQEKVERPGFHVGLDYNKNTTGLEPKY